MALKSSYKVLRIPARFTINFLKLKMIFNLFKLFVFSPANSEFNPIELFFSLSLTLREKR
jgi:hypothetical protein